MPENEQKPPTENLHRMIKNYVGFLIEQAQTYTPSHPTLCISMGELYIFERDTLPGGCSVLLKFQYDDITIGLTDRGWDAVIAKVMQLLENPDLLGAQQTYQLLTEVMKHD